MFLGRPPPLNVQFLALSAMDEQGGCPTSSGKKVRISADDPTATSAREWGEALIAANRGHLKRHAWIGLLVPLQI